MERRHLQWFEPRALLSNFHQVDAEWKVVRFFCIGWRFDYASMFKWTTGLRVNMQSPSGASSRNHGFVPPPPQFSPFYFISPSVYLRRPLPADISMSISKVSNRFRSKPSIICERPLTRGCRGALGRHARLKWAFCSLAFTRLCS